MKPFGLFIIALSLIVVSASHTSAAPSAGSSPHLKKIFEKGVIRIGVQILSPLYQQQEEKQGIDVEIANQIGADLGVKVELVTGTPSELIDMVSQGVIDMSLGGISSTVQRGLKIRFTRAYIIATPAGLLNRMKLPEESASIDFPKRRIESLRDLQIPGRLIVGVRSGSTNETIFRTDKKFSTYQIETFKTNLDVLDALTQNRIDLLVGDDLWIRSILKTRPELITKFQPILGSYSEEHLSVALPPGDPEFLLFIDFMIKEYRRTGIITQILERYIDVTRDVR